MEKELAYLEKVKEWIAVNGATFLVDVVVVLIILIVGNEACGLQPELQQAASDRVRIPMQAGCDSLNVAVAAAIMMYKLTAAD